MDRESYATVLLAVCCIAAAGMSATTLESTLTQTPDDVVDIDFSKLPMGEDSGKSVKGAIQSTEGNEQAGADDESDESGDQSSNPSDQSSQSEESGSSDSDAVGAPGGQDGEAPGAGTGELSLLQRLLLLLEQLMPLIAALIVLALAYRYRRQILALTLAVASVLGETTHERTTSTSTWPSESPSNEVHSAWLTMVKRSGVDRPQSRTPSQCATAAVAANLDPSAVETLTTLFEEVRYGDKPVTDERRNKANEQLARLDGGETV